MQDINFRRHYVRHLPRGVSQNEIIRSLASPLINDGMVEPDFADHVIAREENFPTGLPVEPIGVAIPHTDHKHVRKNAICVGILAEPVSFEEMGGEPEPVPVRVVFMLALGESNKQLNVLGWVMDVIQDGEFMQRMLVMNDDEIYQSIYTRLSERGEL
ncbi:PTS sugar transporter subunit IIA [Trabulsiella odontotermitis]|uniref:PTS sugar transporter subunit IIA n=1 Tax=Trabulsiella odontotermitis TaxID=379893 RepID=UPI000676586A|nr:PTS sugar transporter subunit IIA [Trabulsiella odontotermitis]KNC92319.1 PTS suar transporter subunit IIA [Trabulsiella odontotermitis]